jgi:hypothetical protein
MLHGFVDYHQFSVISTVFLLCWAKLHGEESEGLPGILHTFLQYGSHGGCWGVCDEGQWCWWVGGLLTGWHMRDLPCISQRQC